ncbi:MAG: cupin domain-containing protein [Rhodospirillaceae bacterium]|jgi:uncharacterized RmlC-like cupin family protein|nr:cupin domain-containing protein [Rhodospirillaceae bacterium]MBT4590018.1 cupin domain-containing protein [Rhodospirillaceae bacterium]MBT4937898.1 cupin domain-containing protein [Rhodospirillaceae bacterium]MBT5941383.1 cupin domain-containing protein [Rhodospirillaceae bacterium]MBT7268031.1 cupin domain-containing protein [Rhodospirillaceae bacterium]
MKTVIVREPREDLQYAPSLVTGFGINDETVENAGMVMGTSIMPPGGRNYRHYHVNGDLSMYKIKGRDKLLIGPDDDLQELDFVEGDFVYIPRGEIHGAYNTLDEPGFLVFCYTGINNVKELQKVYVEEPPED